MTLCGLGHMFRSMTNDLAAPRYVARFTKMIWKVTVTVFAIAGFIWLAGKPLLRLLVGPMFTTEIVQRTYSPDRGVVAEVEVRRATTVWTTRVKVGMPGHRKWTVYENGDSDFVPPLRWLDRRTLLVGLPCGRFEHLSNPDDWEAGEPRPDRVRVRFELPNGCE